MGRLAALAMLCLLPTALSAQDVEQTPDGAHRFLQLISESQQVVLNYSRHRWPKFSSEYRVQMTRADDCRSVLSGIPMGYMAGKRWRFPGTPQFDETRMTALMKENKLPIPPVAIDWAGVSSVQLVDGLIVGDATLPQQVVLINVGAGGFWQLKLPDQGTAKRVQYAMLFLKVRDAVP